MDTGIGFPAPSVTSESLDSMSSGMPVPILPQEQISKPVAPQKISKNLSGKKLIIDPYPLCAMKLRCLQTG